MAGCGGSDSGSSRCQPGCFLVDLLGMELVDITEVGVLFEIVGTCPDT